MARKLAIDQAIQVTSPEQLTFEGTCGREQMDEADVVLLTRIHALLGQEQRFGGRTVDERVRSGIDADKVIGGNDRADQHERHGPLLWRQ